MRDRQGGKEQARAWLTADLGIHLRYGGRHAEVDAIEGAGRGARDATAYVTLEPCTTTGKTGPCVEALAKAGVRRVVWAAADPNPAHRGRAAKALRAHGIVAEGPAFRTDPNPEFTIALRRRSRPTARGSLAKWAQSLDGRLAFTRGERASISGAESRRWVHDLRGHVEAVAVGVGTVLADDPRLDCRLPGGPPDGRAQPAAVVFDSTLRRAPIGSRLVRGATLDRPLLLYVARACPARRLRAFASARGVVVTSLRGPPTRGPTSTWRAPSRHLRSQGCRSPPPRGRRTTGGGCFRRGLVDQVAAIVAPLLLGGDGAPTALAGTGIAEVLESPRLLDARVSALGHDALIQGFLRVALSASEVGARGSARPGSGSRSRDRSRRTPSTRTSGSRPPCGRAACRAASRSTPRAAPR